MNLKKIISINEAIKDILPKSYPRPRICLYEDEAHLVEAQDMDNQQAILFAVYDPNIDTINIPIKDSLELSDIDLAKVLIHEYGHAYLGHKYGFSSKEYSDEAACDKFALRWVKKLGDIIDHQENARFCGWRKEEVEYLTVKYPNAPKDRMVARLGRSWPAIRRKAYLLGLRRNSV